ncbi:MAG: hypothetical protein DCF19_03025 [Pseudanabaena frigida]|uniref:PD-(D/E)XK motif protein n=1 Tax=Pseudanabaena frigida TaxID=945775 RepID=A0A2W4WQR6_9CYAN|nr:MAG: hypothetical protein DCF19_03025 [Pseudanabaena frigida]
MESMNLRTKMKIEIIWEELENQIKNHISGYLTRRIFPDANHDIYLAIEYPSRTRMLMIYVDRTSIEKSIVFPTSSGFEVRQMIFPEDERIALQLLLTNNRYKDIFTALVQDIAENIAFIPVETDVVQMLANRLKRWQMFLEKHDLEGLSEEIQHGLYGELWFLRQVVIPRFGLSSLSYWLGPEGANQDFSFEGCAVEIKTTVSQNPKKLSISNENQLDETRLNTLVLMHLSLDARANGETLPEIVESLRVILGKDSSSRELFEKRLFQIGYLDIHAPKYSETSYKHRTSSYFKIEQDFPRIVPADLKQGIVQVRYSIEISACRSYAITESEVIESINNALNRESTDNHG